jgi:hypothetical protein
VPTSCRCIQKMPVIAIPTQTSTLLLFRVDGRYCDAQSFFRRSFVIRVFQTWRSFDLCRRGILLSSKAVYLPLPVDSLGAAPLTLHRLRRLILSHPVSLPLQAAPDILNLAQLGEVLGEDVQHADHHLDFDAAVGDNFLCFGDFLDVVDFEDTTGPLLADVFEVCEAVEPRSQHADVLRDEVRELFDALELVAEL